MHHRPEPTHCDLCCSTNIKFEYYKPKRFTEQRELWPYRWICLDCKAAVGCIKDSRKPLGIMADSQTRLLRAKTHTILDKIWRTGIMSREDTYQWAARQLNISNREDAHISWLNMDQLSYLKSCAERYFDERREVGPRRKEKRRDKAKKQDRREINAIVARKRRRNRAR